MFCFFILLLGFWWGNCVAQKKEAGFVWGGEKTNGVAADSVLVSGLDFRQGWVALRKEKPTSAWLFSSE